MKIIKPVTLVSGLISILLLSFPTSASAETNCRDVARNVQSDGSMASVNDPSGSAVLKVFTDAEAAYPECQKEIEEVFSWNVKRDPNIPFPFPKSGDPKSYPLGPVSWWWDVIYNKLFDGNTLLMFLFGWEIFLIPAPIILMAIARYVPQNKKFVSILLINSAFFDILNKL